MLPDIAILALAHRCYDMTSEVVMAVWWLVGSWWWCPTCGCCSYRVGPLDPMVVSVAFSLLAFTANIFPVMVTGFPCVHLFPCRPPVPPTGIPCYLMNRGIPVIILHVLHVTCKSLFALRGLTCYHTTSTSICFTDKTVLILQGFSCYSDRQKIVSWTGIWLQI